MDHSVTHRSEELATLMRDRLGVRLGEEFETKVKQAGRRLPRWARRKSSVIIEAVALDPLRDPPLPRPPVGVRP